MLIDLIGVSTEMSGVLKGYSDSCERNNRERFWDRYFIQGNEDDMFIISSTSLYRMLIGKGELTGTGRSGGVYVSDNVHLTDKRDCLSACERECQSLPINRTAPPK